MKKFFKKISGLALVIATISVWAFYSYQNESVTTTAEALSNQKIGWGIKRAENHEQPDLGTVNLELINKYDGIAIR